MAANLSWPQCVNLSIWSSSIPQEAELGQNHDDTLYCVHIPILGVILYMRPANGRWRYSVTPSLIGWMHTQNDHCYHCGHGSIGESHQCLRWPLWHHQKVTIVTSSKVTIVTSSNMTKSWICLALGYASMPHSFQPIRSKNNHWEWYTVPYWMIIYLYIYSRQIFIHFLYKLN